MKSCQVKFVEGSGNQFEIRTFGEAEGADGLPVEVVTGTTRTTLALAKQQVEIAQAKLSKAQDVFDQIKIAVKQQALDAAKALEDETKE